MKFLCATVLLSIVVVTKAVQFVDCGSKDCKINSLDVSNCAADAQSCDFPRGQTINMTLKFTTTSSSSVNGLTNAISGYVSGIWVPFKKTNVCDSLGTCPLKTGTAATYILTLSISNDYPKISVPVKSDMTDDAGNICTCFEIQGRIV